MTMRMPRHWLALGLGLALAVMAFTQVASDRAEAVSDNPSPANSITGYLKVVDIPGESTVEGREGWSEILSFQWGILGSGFGQGASGGPGVGAGRKAATLEEIIVVKDLDSAGTYLADYAVRGKVAPEADLELVATGDDGRQVYYEISLQNVRITSYSVGTTGQKDLTPGGLPLVAAHSGRPVEQVTLAYEKITVTYTEQNVDGSLGDSHTFTFDVKTNK